MQMEDSANEVYDTDHKFPNAQIEWWDKVSDVEHGIEGHTGFRCLQCARLSVDGMVSIVDDSGDYWQDQQLAWQEECDEIHTAFDEASAAHWPDHLPINCQDCPVTTPMPPKPNPPVERRRYD